MSNLKCPFCQDTLIPCIKNQNDWIYHCDNQKCPMYDDADIENAKHTLASEDLWQELIRTRKALDVAWDGLEKIGSGDIIEHSVVGHEDDNKIFIANKALNESKTALEQKDVK